MTETRWSQTGEIRPSGEREFVTSLVLDPLAPVVEVGAGGCACLTLVLAGQGLRILAIDRDADAVAYAQRVLAGARFPGMVTLVQADAAALPLQSASIRTVVAYDALHHVEDLRGAVAEIARVLHPRGRLIVSDWDEASNGFLGRLTQALRAHFHKVVVIPRDVRQVYLCEHPRRVAWRAGPWLHRK
ncbi:MAG: class I SAM-dependent methyltransferase [candidate division NC10 bacterium]|nr:class I SAM-dependent methyltransferase [candidate division NC10 bacterium]